MIKDCKLHTIHKIYIDEKNTLESCQDTIQRHVQFLSLSKTCFLKERTVKKHFPSNQLLLCQEKWIKKVSKIGVATSLNIYECNIVSPHIAKKVWLKTFFHTTFDNLNRQSEVWMKSAIFIFNWYLGFIYYNG